LFFEGFPLNENHKSEWISFRNEATKPFCIAKPGIPTSIRKKKDTAIINKIRSSRNLALSVMGKKLFSGVEQILIPRDQ
jgi:hypothetical protein